jgi:hypothetical protein
MSYLDFLSYDSVTIDKDSDNNIIMVYSNGRKEKITDYQCFSYIKTHEMSKRNPPLNSVKCLMEMAKEYNAIKNVENRHEIICNMLPVTIHK